MNEQEIINNISESIFNREYNDLKDRERKFIDDIVHKKQMPEGLKMYLQAKAAEYILNEMEDENRSESEIKLFRSWTEFALLWARPWACSALREL